MTMLKNSTQMIEAGYSEDAPAACFFDQCRRPIRLFDKYFIDVLWDRVYCHQCGLCLRYARKKALERGETVESARIEL